MKAIKKVFNCLESYIKKNFFNLSKTDIPHDCEEVFGLNFSEENEKVTTDEYDAIYNSTTRWQTL